jgi:hypothetical protein
MGVWTGFVGLGIRSVENFCEYQNIVLAYIEGGAWGSVVDKATSRTVPGSIPGRVTGFFQ